MAAAPLFFGYGRKVDWVFIRRMLVRMSSFGSLFSLAKVNTLLAWVMRLVILATIAFDMSRALLALQPTMLALCYRTTFLWNKGEFPV